MLTRDIRLEDAILDLLDNCVDGVLRSGLKEGEQRYAGFKAEIEFNSMSFSISDNCGGIPWSLRDYAFRMGRAPDRPSDASGSVGVYGIGMKRAIFKLGRHCLISSRNAEDQYEIEIDSDWLENEDSWDMPVRDRAQSTGSSGTTITVGELYPVIASTFAEGAESFNSELKRMIATHYAYIMDKGFEVIVNGASVRPRIAQIVFKEGTNVVKPFLFEASENGVDVYLAVGFTRPLPSDNELEEESEAPRYSSIDAGWTILCNDRAVVYCDRTELTGWGEASVPRFHPQFIAISGVVEFRSDDPSKLPTTTTKRGIDASSSLYLKVKNKMREGMKIFTDYTNKWKGHEGESKRFIDQGTALSLEQIKRTRGLTFSATHTLSGGKQFKPKLPRPQGARTTTRKISFVREKDEIDAVAEHLGDSSLQPNEVGERCFDVMHAEAVE